MFQQIWIVKEKKRQPAIALTNNYANTIRNKKTMQQFYF